MPNETKGKQKFVHLRRARQKQRKTSACILARRFSKKYVNTETKENASMP
jgi:hypothetical protein